MANEIRSSNSSYTGDPQSPVAPLTDDELKSLWAWTEQFSKTFPGTLVRMVEICRLIASYVQLRDDVEAAERVKGN